MAMTDEQLRQALAEYLQAADPNGCHSDADSAAEGYEPATLAGLAGTLAAMLAQSSPQAAEAISLAIQDVPTPEEITVWRERLSSRP